MGKHGCVIAAASLALWLSGWLGGFLGGCAFDSTPMGSAVCVDGQSAECACEDGSRGLHSCSQGEFGACACGPGDAADPGNAPPADASGSGSSANGSTSAGSGGAASGGTAGASGGTAGSAAGPSAGAGSTAGSGAPHPGGEGGSTGAAGSGGSAGGAGSDGGSGGSAGGDPIPAPPGTAYGFCAAQADCKDGLVCTASLDNSASGYCAPFCMFNGGGGNAGGCQQPTSGEVQAQCAPLVGMCLLTACQNKDCPARMECVQSTLPFGQQDIASNCRYLTK